MRRIFFKAIEAHAVQGFEQFYFIVAESTVKHFCGRWFYNGLDKDFYEADVFPLNAYKDSGIAFGKKVNWEKLVAAVKEGYVSLYRVPKQPYKQQFPETLIF